MQFNRKKKSTLANICSLLPPYVLRFWCMIVALLLRRRQLLCFYRIPTPSMIAVLLLSSCALYYCCAFAVSCVMRYCSQWNRPILRDDDSWCGWWLEKTETVKVVEHSPPQSRKTGYIGSKTVRLPHYLLWLVLERGWGWTQALWASEHTRNMACCRYLRGGRC